MIRFLHSMGCMGTREYVGAKIERSPRKSAKKTDLRCMTLTVYRGACEIKRDCINISRLEMHKKENITPFEGKLTKT